MLVREPEGEDMELELGAASPLAAGIQVLNTFPYWLKSTSG